MVFIKRVYTEGTVLIKPAIKEGGGGGWLKKNITNEKEQILKQKYNILLTFIVS